MYTLNLINDENIQIQLNNRQGHSDLKNTNNNTDINNISFYDNFLKKIQKDRKELAIPCKIKSPEVPKRRSHNIVIPPPRLSKNISHQISALSLNLKPVKKKFSNLNKRALSKDNIADNTIKEESNHCVVPSETECKNDIKRQSKPGSRKEFKLELLSPLKKPIIKEKNSIEEIDLKNNITLKIKNTRRGWLCCLPIANDSKIRTKEAVVSKL